MTGRIVVIGVGNPFRRDDGVGPAAVEALRDQVPDDTVLAVSDGEPGRMLDLWRDDDTVIVVEAVRMRPAHPGRLHTLPVDAVAYPSRSASTHALALGETFALAAALDRLPREVVVHVVEASDVGLGTGLSEPVRSAFPELIDRAAASVRNARDPHHY